MLGLAVRAAYVPAFAGQSRSRTTAGRATAGADSKLNAEWSDDDLRELTRIARKYRITDPEFILRVMGSESGMHPWAVNKASDGSPVAVGLLQFTRIATKSLRITEAEWATIPAKSVREQLVLVDRFYASQPWTKAGRVYDAASTVYMANAAPNLMLSKGVSLDTVLYDAEKNPDAYNGNKGLDVEKKGYITVRDLARRLDKIEKMPSYQEMVKRLRSVGGYGEGGGMSGASMWLAWGAVAVVAGGIAYATLSQKAA